MTPLKQLLPQLKESEIPKVKRAGKDAIILEPVTKLKEKASNTESGFTFDAAAINKAEKALEELSVNFEEWVGQEVQKLDEARKLFIEDPANEKHAEMLFDASHDLKGHATTFGYPIAHLFCTSLCRLLDLFEDKPRIPQILINQHVDAVRALVKEKVKTKNDEKAMKLMVRLRTVTNECIEHELKRIAKQT